MMELLRKMHWVNARGKTDWFEISTDIAFLAVLGVCLWMIYLYS